MQIKLSKAIGFGVLMWVIGFVWGTVVFMTPALKGFPSIAMFSRYPVISFPLLVLFPLMAYWFAPKCVERGAASGGAGLHAGLVFVVVNVLLDWLVLVMAFKSEGYFFFLSVWLAHALVVVAAQAATKPAPPPKPPKDPPAETPSSCCETTDQKRAANRAFLRAYFALGSRRYFLSR